MITFTRTPEFYAPLGGKALYTFESDTPGTFDVRIADAASDKMLGAMRFTEVAEATFDAAPVLRRALRYTPATGGTGISQATGRQVMADVKIYEGPEGTEAVAEAGLCLLLGTDRAVQAPALLSSMPRQRLIAPGECDELTLFCSRSGAVIVTAQRGRDYTAESYRIPSPGLFLFRLDTRDFPGAETLTVDTGECGTVVYSLVAAPQGAVRLAWRSEAGSIEHYTFPIVATERMKSSKRRATDAEGQAVVLSGSAEVRRRLVSAYECEEVARALAGIVASPDVRIARGDEYIPVEVLTEELDVRDEGELRSLEIEIRKNSTTWN